MGIEVLQTIPSFYSNKQLPFIIMELQIIHKLFLPFAVIVSGKGGGNVK
jgi:hypothetical protein